MHIVLSICLDYLHFGETLFAFGRFPADGIKATVPNVVCISPVHRQDVEMQLSINLDAISAALGLDATMEQTPPEQEVAEAAAPEEESNSKVFPSKNDLVRAAVKEEFESQFSIVKAEFSGVSFETKTVSLSEFYQKHGIAKGRLKGNWRLFEKETLKDIMDEGVVWKARDVVFRKYTANIPGYGRIVRNRDIEALRAELSKIALDYRRYLERDQECCSIGSIPISKPFSPWDAISESLNALLEYLIAICPAKGLETERYIQDAKRFVDKTCRELRCFSGQVRMRMTESSYRDSQWKNRDLINCVWEAISVDRKFFGDRFVALLERYSNLLSAEDTD